MSRVGEVLREARLAKGLSLADVEQATHIRERILNALEEGDYSALPSAVYLRGLTRSYASYLNLDGAQIGALLDQEIGLSEEGEVRPAVREIQTPSTITAGVVVLAIAVVGFAALIWYLGPLWVALEATAPASPSSALAEAPTSTATPAGVAPTASALAVAIVPTPSPTLTPSSTPSPTPTVTVTPTITPTPTPTYGVVIEASFTKRCWVHVKIDGEDAFIQTVLPGENHVWKGRESVWMHAGQPDGVEITFNGKYLGVLSTSGGTVKVEWTRPE